MTQDDADRVRTPAIALIVTGILLLVLDLLNAFWSLFAVLSPIIQLFVMAMAIVNGDDTGEIVAAGGQAVFGTILAGIKIVAAIVGLAASGVTILARLRLLQFRSRNIVTLGAALAALQPILWVITGCFTSGCGICAPLVYLPLAILGLVAVILTVTTLGSIEPFPDEFAA